MEAVEQAQTHMVFGKKQQQKHDKMNYGHSFANEWSQTCLAYLGLQHPHRKPNHWFIWFHRNKPWWI